MMDSMAPIHPNPQPAWDEGDVWNRPPIFGLGQTRLDLKKGNFGSAAIDTLILTGEIVVAAAVAQYIYYYPEIWFEMFRRL
jgi:hypothetical protein